MKADHSHSSTSAYPTSDKYRENYRRLEEERKKKKEQCATQETKEESEQTES
jgi:hypothetical protein